MPKPWQLLWSSESRTSASLARRANSPARDCKVPELPEVEVLRRQLNAEILGQRIESAGSHWSKKFTPARKVVGAQLTETRRRGKYLLLGLDDGRELIIHLGMSGSVALLPTPKSALSSQPDTTPSSKPGSKNGAAAPITAEAEPHCRAWWTLSGGHTMLLRDMRRFGRVLVTPRDNYAGLGTLAAMGPEPFDPTLDANTFWQRTRKSSQQIKTQLLGQRLIAGVGNIYADEALFGARIRPTARQITKAQAARLLTALQKALCAGIANGGTTLRNYASLAGSGGNQHHLSCYGRAGQPCVVCGTTLERMVIDARGTTWCPACQK